MAGLGALGQGVEVLHRQRAAGQRSELFRAALRGIGVTGHAQGGDGNLHRRQCGVGVPAFPAKSTEPATGAGAEAYLYITNRPGEDVVSEFNIVAGYTFQTGSVATVSVGGQSFNLFTQGDAAWLDDAGQSTALAAAIRAGSTLSVEGTNATGARVVQSYSLSGATAAQQAIGAEC